MPGGPGLGVCASRISLKHLFRTLIFGLYLQRECDTMGQARRHAASRFPGL